MLSCRVCGSSKVEPLIDFGPQPIVHHLKKHPSEAAASYSFCLGHCSQCDLLQLTKPISPEILYENYFTVSNWKNQPHVERLIQVMKAVGGLNPSSRLLEIGCNDGSFLGSLKAHGVTNCLGIEPALDAYNLAIGKGLDVSHDFFGSTTVGRFEEKSFDVIVTRQVLEHIVDLDDFVASIKIVLKQNGVLVIEIPDSMWNLENLDYALWEEHVNYFTLHTVEQLLKKHDLAIIHHETTLFSGRALTVFAEKAHKPFVDRAFRSVDAAAIRKYQQSWPILKQRFHETLATKTRPIIYGCGARSSTFLNFLELDAVECFVDDQVDKQGFYLPGADLPINPWREEYRDGYFMLGVNTENETKIIDKLGLTPDQFCSILPPSRFLPDFWKELIRG